MFRRLPGPETAVLDGYAPCTHPYKSAMQNRFTVENAKALNRPGRDRTEGVEFGGLPAEPLNSGLNSLANVCQCLLGLFLSASWIGVFSMTSLVSPTLARMLSMRDCNIEQRDSSLVGCMETV